jgi:apolipoprotein N-acyltransferase
VLVTDSNSILMSGALQKLPRGILCLITGALMPLAYAPGNISFIAILCPALLLLVWIGSSPRNAFRYGYLFGLGMFGVGVYWLHISINMFGGVNIIGALLITALLVAFLSLYPALVGYIGRRWFSQNDAMFLLIAAPALWVVAEWTRAWFLTGFPWLNLGYSQTDSFLSGLAPLFGVYGVTWLTILIAALLVCLYRYKRQCGLAVVVAIALLSVSCWSLTQINWTKATKENVAVALIQAAIPQELKWRPELREQSLELYMKLSAPHWGDALIIWPETAIPAFNYTVTNFIEKLGALTDRHDSTFLSGIPSKEAEVSAYYNSVMMLSDGKTALYHKQHLVPFGEYLPLKSLLGVILDFLRIPMSDFSPGQQESPVLSTNGMSIGVSICYEDTFGEEVIKALPEASVLVNVSNDAWFGDSLAPHQHLQMARMRALESGRYMLRATNTGISAVIDEKGKIVVRSPQFKPRALSARITLFEGSTPYVLWGNIPVVICAFLSIILLLVFQKRKKID